ncbi:MAG: hypothetical protein H0Z32_04600 [Bacillaceae bacterium]|nr:hypothetical protein [Bacillaceae bacterium]
MRKKLKRSLIGYSKKSIHETESYLTLRYKQMKESMRKEIYQLTRACNRIKAYIQTAKEREGVYQPSFLQNEKTNIQNVQQLIAISEKQLAIPSLKLVLFGRNRRQTEEYFHSIQLLLRDDLNEEREDLKEVIFLYEQLMDEWEVLEKEGEEYLLCSNQQQMNEKGRSQSKNEEGQMFKEKLFIKEEIEQLKKIFEDVQRSLKENNYHYPLLYQNLWEGATERHEKDLENSHNQVMNNSDQKMDAKDLEAKVQQEPFESPHTEKVKKSKDTAIDELIIPHIQIESPNNKREYISEFWGDIGRYLVTPDYQAKVKLPLTTKQKATSRQTPDSIQPSFEQKSDPRQAKPDYGGLENISSSISREIQSLRHKYLIGKVAGEDLRASNNQLLIPKGAFITEETIQLAEQEGMLEELILNMEIPGLGD